VRLLRWIVRACAVLAVIYLYFALWHPREHVADHPYFDAQRPWVIAHQGGLGLWPQNTLYAFEHALELGVDVLEMDLHATSDGMFVVMHDARVDRTTNGSGRIDSMTLAEVRSLDAGYRFQDESGEYPFRDQGLQVPMFEEVLSRFVGARLVVEMKEFSPESAVELCRMIEESQATDRVLVASFGQESMRAFRGACPKVATSATSREVVLLHVFRRLHLASLYRGPAVALQVPESSGGLTVVDPGLIELAKELNVAIQVWTINDESDMERLLEMGVQGIITDYPNRLLRVMGRGR